MKKLFLLDAAGHAALLGLGYYWLGLGEASVAQLVWTAVLGLGLALLAGWLVALPFNGSAAVSARRAPAMLPWLVFAGALASFCLFVASSGDGVTRALAAFLRIGVDPDKAATVMKWVAVVLAMLLMFGWALPVAGRIARAGLRTDWRPPRLPMTYWFVAIGYVLAGLLLPWWLFFWTPAMSGAYAELGSFVARTGLALVLYVGGWLGFARYLGGQTALPEA